MDSKPRRRTAFVDKELSRYRLEIAALSETLFGWCLLHIFSGLDAKVR